MSDFRGRGRRTDDGAALQAPAQIDEAFLRLELAPRQQQRYEQIRRTRPDEESPLDRRPEQIAMREQLAAAEKLLSEGKSQRATARELGLSRKRVGKIVRGQHRTE